MFASERHSSGACAHVHLKESRCGKGIQVLQPQIWMVVFAALAFGACNENGYLEEPSVVVPVGRACTLIGCNSGLSVALQPSVSALPYSVRFDLPDGPNASFICTISGPRDVAGPIQNVACNRDALSVSLSPVPRRVTIEVFVAGGAGDRRVGSFTPDYQLLHPNGRGCPPACLRATVVLEADR